MTDNILFWCAEVSVIKHLTKSFFEGQEGLYENFNNEHTFKLYNPDNYHAKNYMRVSSVGFGRFLTVRGSLRKWYLGENSIGDTLNDFTHEYEDAIKLLLSLLGIKYSKAKHLNIARIEIGINVEVSEKCSEVLHRFVGYRSVHYEPALRKSYKKFESKGLNITMYNKVLEISKDFRKKKIKTEEQKRFLKENEGRDILRIEFTAKGGHTKIKNRLGIGTISESVTYFGLLYIFFWDSLQDIQFTDMYCNEPILDAKGKTQKEILDFVKLYGIFMLGEERIKEMVDESKNPRNTRQVIKRLQNNTKARYGSYSKESLMKDVKRQLVLSMQKSGWLHLAKEGLSLSPKVSI
ncbi:hypothetical protein NXX53_11945 [Bacteroides salyersiae]|jgi:hypothetical protein|uniref:hypothetical protein n=1 Tax=Bacteroides salyersiae TaxID=291644 RepID=UPI00125E6545|nr:hypothetical protein [Bacteroides salyersiae]KAB5345288.1 hypothetical protein GAA62_17610 [Bacteroides salyersiae]KAB5353765.1 hypothetical protein GAA37_08910 [Bacteroides salyersiae]KAB5361698.1 hypothetical protein F9967_10275 [Bacteroides salyersiae]KAB5366665.1 hypothetical protein GAA00_16835 [Bacteroides salyersiae]KAB5374401.1 hypothetical protein F9993_12220 [Bacteroides salyersiae]